MTIIWATTRLEPETTEGANFLIPSFYHCATTYIIVNANSWQVTNVFPICNMVRCHAALSFRSSTRSYYKEAVILMFSSSCTTRQAWLYWLELNWSQVGWIYSRNSWIHIRCSDMFDSLSDMPMDTSLLVYIISYRRHHSSRAFEEDTIRSVLQIIWCFVSSYC